MTERVKVEVVLGLDVDDYEKGLTHVKQQATRLVDTFATVGLAATAALGALSVKSFVDFESAFAGVRKTVNATEDEFRALEAGFRDMSKVIPVAAGGLAGIGEVAGQLGIKTRNLLDFTRTMADLGEATVLTSNEAAAALAVLDNVTGGTQTTFDRLGSTLVALGNNFPTTERDILDMANTFAAIGHQVGLSQAEILSFATAFKAVGAETQAAGSAFQRVMLEMRKSVFESGKSLEVFAQTAGVTTTEFARLFREDAAQAILAFIEGLARMEASGQDATKVLDELGLADIRIVREFMKATSGVHNFTGALELGAQAWEENTALTEEARRRYETLASKFQVFINQATDVAITIGGTLAPPLTKLLSVTQGLIVAYSDLPPWLQVAALGFATLGFAGLKLGANIKDLTKTKQGLGLIVDQDVLPKLAKMNAAIVGLSLASVKAAATNAAWGLANVGLTATLIGMEIALAPITLTVLGIAAAVTAGILLWKNWDTVTAAVTRGLEWLGNGIETVVRFLGLWEPVVAAASFVANRFADVVTGLSQSYAGFLQAVGMVADFLGTTWNATVGAAADGLDWLDQKTGILTVGMEGANAAVAAAAGGWGWLAGRWNAAADAAFGVEVEQEALAQATLKSAAASQAAEAQMIAEIREAKGLQAELYRLAAGENAAARAAQAATDALKLQEGVTREKGDSTEDLRNKLRDMHVEEDIVRKLVKETTTAIERQADGTWLVADSATGLTTAWKEVNGELRLQATLAEDATSKMDGTTAAMGRQQQAAKGVATALDVWRQVEKELADAMVAREFMMKEAGHFVFDLGRGFQGTPTAGGGFAGVTGPGFQRRDGESDQDYSTRLQHMGVDEFQRRLAVQNGITQFSFDKETVLGLSGFATFEEFNQFLQTQFRNLQLYGDPRGPQGDGGGGQQPPSFDRRVIGGGSGHKQDGSRFRFQVWQEDQQGHITFQGLENAPTASGSPSSVQAAIGNITDLRPTVQNAGIQWFAKGGIVDGLTPAILGDNPSGREAIIPLERAEEFGFGGAGDRAEAVPQIYIEQLIVQDGRDFDRTLASWGVKRRSLG